VPRCRLFHPRSMGCMARLESRYVSRCVCVLVRAWTVSRYEGYEASYTICFTICLFISPDLDSSLTICAPHVCFTICLFISPDLDGNRGTSTKKTSCLSRYVFTICFEFFSVRHTGQQEYTPSVGRESCKLWRVRLGGRRTMCRIGLVICILVVFLRLGAGGGEYSARRRCMGCSSSDAERAPAYASQLRDPPTPTGALLMESMGTGAAVICEVPMAHNELGGLPSPNEAAQRHRACAWRLSLRGGRSKRSGKRVRKALEESGGRSTAAARFPTGSWQSKVSLVSIRTRSSLPGFRISTCILAGLGISPLHQHPHHSTPQTPKPLTLEPRRPQTSPAPRRRPPVTVQIPLVVVGSGT
jgi:hypothetical protein